MRRIIGGGLSHAKSRGAEDLVAGRPESIGAEGPSIAALVDAVISDRSFAERGARAAKIVWSSSRPVSSVYRVRIDFDATPQDYWIKTHSEASLGEAIREYRFMSEAQDLFDGERELGVPRTVLYLPEHAAIVSEHVEGEPLATLIRRAVNRVSAIGRDRAPIRRHLERCGEWLAVLHSDRSLGEEPYAPEWLRDYIAERVDRLRSDSGIDEAFRRGVLDRLDRLIERFRAEDCVRVRSHGDYAPYNALVSDDRFVAFDPGVGSYMTRLGNFSARYDDLAHCLHFTQTMSAVYVGRGVRDELSAAFLRGYAGRSGLAVDPESPAFRAFRMKYALLEVTGMAWPSMFGRLTSGRLRVAGFRRWIEKNT